MALILPQETEVETQDGTVKKFVVSKVPAIPMREIITQYPLSALPKLGDYRVNEEIMFKLLSYVAVVFENGETLQLSTRALIDNHVPDWETLMRLEMAMLEYNCSFFQKGRTSTFLEGIAPKVPMWISKISTAYSESLSRKGAPRS